jgi:hypothetical protein
MWLWSNGCSIARQCLLLARDTQKSSDNYRESFTWQCRNSIYDASPITSSTIREYQKTDFVIFSAEGAENNKIGFITRIANQEGAKAT